jgi:ubiquinone/menaquinone biosynthesis methyltransferase
MARLRDFDMAAHVADPARKAAFVTPMFDLIAPRYDDFTRRFSFGMDSGWKRSLIDRALTHSPAPRDVVDLACGTGDLGAAVATRVADARVTGVDASREMLGLARQRGTAVTFRDADLAQLPFADASVDLMTAGYAFRNGLLAPSLAECARVARPGAVLAVLDFYRPVRAVWRTLFLAYLRAAGNIVGWWWHREPVAYGYIAHSIDTYVSVAGFSDAARLAGFEPIEVGSFLGGGVAIHILRRRNETD